MNKLLMVIDMQNDFIDGSLGTKEAAAILPRVAAKIKEYQANGDEILFTMDTHFDHYLDTQEGKKLPVPHCIKGTKGWELAPALREIISGYEYPFYEKFTFGSSALALAFSRGDYSHITHITLVGLCTDICVISNALLAKTFLPEVPITVDASCCAGVTPDSHENALKAMEMCQIQIQRDSFGFLR
ncbi:MAG: cysteine hydrolase family protein [Ruminococcus sp.]|jgi:nicotinamidase/pyrazinamidase